MRYIAALLAAWLVVPVVSCGSQPADMQQSDDVLVSVGDSALTVAEVLRRMPAGLSPADSANMFERIVGHWVRDLVLLDVAEKNIPDPDRIERMVEAYRNGLIVDQYLSTVSEHAVDDVSEKRIKEYFDSHRGMLVLEQPLVRGVFVKVAENDETLDNLRD